MQRQNRELRAPGVSQWMIMALSLIALAAPVYADATTFAIDPQDLSGALKAFAVQSHREIFFAPELARGRQSKGVKGIYDALKALNIILEGTGLEYSVTTSDAILVRDPASKADSSRASVIPATSANSDPTDPALRMAQAESPQPQLYSDNTHGSAGQPVSTAGSDKARLEEILVTAQKRSERLQDVPVPVTAITADILVNSNQLQLQDYYTRVPGLNVAVNPYGAPQVTIRGLTTGGFSNPTVGIVVDDVPFGPSSSLAFAEDAPDVDPSDLARVEVLRGPQGTLYGASSLGGLIKYVTVDPSTDALTGRVQVGTSGVTNGANLGYNVRGSVNIPLNDTMAIRASGFTREDPGYIDNILTGERGVNEARVDGGRLSGLWRPSDVFSLKLSALVQHATSGGSSAVDVGPGLGDLQQDNVRGTGGYDKTLQAYSATVAAKLGVVDLTAVTGYNVNRVTDSIDYTSLLGPLTQSGIPGSGFDGFGASGTPLFNHLNTSKFTQEIRLSAPIGEHIEWVVGAFYEHESTDYAQDLLATDPLTGEQAGQWAHFELPSTFAEYAGFADLTFHVTDKFDVQVGARESEDRQTYSQTFAGIYDPVFYGVPSPIIYPAAHSDTNAFTYLVTPRFKFSPDLMVYARLASGYRPGGPNIALAGEVPSYKRDTTEHYELGLKGDFLDHSLSFDASVYYIDWKDIQLSLINPVSGLTYTANGSRAKSEGVELSAESRPITGLTLSSWVSYDDAELSEDLPSTSTAYGPSGSRLPYSSRWSGSVAVEQDFPLSDQVTGFVGGAMSYVGDREGVFGTPKAPGRQIFPSYTKADARAGLKYDSWMVDFSVNNIADRRGVLGGGLDNIPTNAFLYIHPRTLSLSLTKTF